MKLKPKTLLPCLLIPLGIGLGTVAFHRIGAAMRERRYVQAVRSRLTTRSYREALTLYYTQAFHFAPESGGARPVILAGGWKPSAQGLASQLHQQRSPLKQATEVEFQAKSQDDLRREWRAEPNPVKEEERARQSRLAASFDRRLWPRLRRHPAETTPLTLQLGRALQLFRELPPVPREVLLAANPTASPEVHAEIAAEIRRAGTQIAAASQDPNEVLLGLEMLWPYGAPAEVNAEISRALETLVGKGSEAQLVQTLVLLSQGEPDVSSPGAIRQLISQLPGCDRFARVRSSPICQGMRRTALKRMTDEAGTLSLRELWSLQMLAGEPGPAGPQGAFKHAFRTNLARAAALQGAQGSLSPAMSRHGEALDRLLKLAALVGWDEVRDHCERQLLETFYRPLVRSSAPGGGGRAALEGAIGVLQSGTHYGFGLRTPGRRGPAPAKPPAKWSRSLTGTSWSYRGPRAPDLVCVVKSGERNAQSLPYRMTGSGASLRVVYIESFVEASLVDVRSRRVLWRQRFGVQPGLIGNFTGIEQSYSRQYFNDGGSIEQVSEGRWYYRANEEPLESKVIRALRGLGLQVR